MGSSNEQEITEPHEQQPKEEVKKKDAEVKTPAEAELPKKLAITNEDAKDELSTLWFIGTAIFIAVLFFQCIYGHYGDKWIEAWAWLSATVLPTFGLIMSAYVAEARQKTSGKKPKDVKSYFYKVTYFISCFHLLLVASIIFISPFSSISTLKLMHLSQLPLGFTQGAVSATLGIFFMTSNTRNT